MKLAFRIAVIMALALALAGGFGCAKKQVTAAPAATTDDDAAAKARQRELEEQERLRKQKEAEAKAKAEAVAEVKNRIFFDFDMYDLKPEARDVLNMKAAALKKYGSMKITIEGHCDERGTEEYNMALGERRAKAAYEYLVLLGIDAGRMTTVSYGEEKPLDPAHTEAAWAKNRRDEFVLTSE